ncbi:putative bifunctional diguanylate cyclase/phosphodiesterase [Halomonas sp.]|uniref:putative bifunctional diguanylate cyclase/phosphodiesterase n=1 Tax=Halomonas sp. TaxID=1486246 RepID=UPI00298DA320|nr:EAL domain-containing protein [Halomonas sp.]MDW7748279.1 EAL domain-containing protein [Halomonas sp.]
MSLDEGNLPYRVRDVALDVGLLMIAATFALLGGAGLVAHILEVAYPLSGLMAADAALTGFLAGTCLFSWLYGWHKLRYLAALPLAVITLYTLSHNTWAGSPWEEVSWVTGGPRILSPAALLLLLVALCTSIGTARHWRRLAWGLSGLLMLAAGTLSLTMMLMPSSRTSWASGFVSAPMLATLYALLGGVAMLGGAWRGSRPVLPIGHLTLLSAVAGVMVSCLAWYVLTWNAQAAIQHQAATLLDSAALNARRVMATQLNLVQRLAWRQGNQGGSRQDGLWNQDVDAYLRHAPYLQGLALIGQDASVDDLRPALPLDQQDQLVSLTNPVTRDWLTQRWETPHVMVDPRDSRTLLVAAPMQESGSLLLATMDLEHLLTSQLGIELGNFRLSVGGDMPYLELRDPGHAHQHEIKRPMPHMERRHVGLPGGARLTFDVHMDSLPAMLKAGIMPGSFAISGLTLSYLLALSLGLVRLVLGRSRELLAARQRLETQYDLEQRFRSLYLYHPDGVFSIDHSGRIVSANAACSEITGRQNEEVLGSHFSFLLQPHDTQRMQEIFTTTLAGQPGRTELQIQHQDGELRSIDLTALPIIVAGETRGGFGIAKDITRQREHEAQIAYQATHDLLTGLPNRTLLDERLEETFLEARKNPLPLLVMHLDLDGFKAVNDGLGHTIGNALLVAVAERLRTLLAPGDTVARMAGDEFCLLLPGRHRDAGINLANRILAALSRPYYLKRKAVHISASIGTASSEGEISHAQELLQQADLAVSDAKRQGRNTWQWYQGDGQRTTAEEVLLRHDLYTALNNEEFALHYQPIVEASSSRVRGFEALIRWHHPKRGLISPGVFIPLAEQTGQIIPLGSWILRRACRDAAELLAEAEATATVAINISSLQFRRPGFLEEVEQALAESGLAPTRLELEVTESILLDGVEQASELIHRLGTLGVRVALDDFGTGFSSLSYLRDLPIHKVKLDRGFIHDITTNVRNAAIVQGVITMAHHMEMVVVAEGIETDTQQEEMRRRGCDLLQGFYFARPAPLVDITAQPLCEPAHSAWPQGDAAHRD